MARTAQTDLVDWAYALVLLGKAALGAAQLAAATAVVLAPSGAFAGLADLLTRWELAEDPTDPIAGAIVRWASAQTEASAHFYAVYLFGHGLLNLGIAAALYLRLPGAFAASMTALSLFVAYQLARFATTGDPALLILTAIDVIVIILALIERRQPRPAQDPRLTP